MIIVSQDKEEIVNFDNIENIWISSDGEGRFTIEATAATNSTLGYYETKERAKEVLNEIRRVYKCSESYKYTRDFTTQGGIVKRMDEENLQIFVYEMPEE